MSILRFQDLALLLRCEEGEDLVADRGIGILEDLPDFIDLQPLHELGRAPPDHLALGVGRRGRLGRSGRSLRLREGGEDDEGHQREAEDEAEDGAAGNSPVSKRNRIPISMTLPS